LLAPVELDLPLLQRHAETAPVPPLLRGLARAPARSTVPSAGVTSALKERLRGSSPTERERVILDLVRSEVAAVLGFAGAAAVPPDQPLQEGGLDSLMAVDLRNRLGALAGTKLRATVVFDHPTPRALGQMLLKHFAPAPEETPPARPEAALDMNKVIAALRAASPDELRALKLAGPLAALIGRTGDPVEAPKPTRAAVETSTMAELFSLIDEELESSG
jgi:hypothetical protein